MKFVSLFVKIDSPPAAGVLPTFVCSFSVWLLLAKPYVNMDKEARVFLAAVLGQRLGQRMGWGQVKVTL